MALMKPIKRIFIRGWVIQIAWRGIGLFDFGITKSTPGFYSNIGLVSLDIYKDDGKFKYIFNNK